MKIKNTWLTIIFTVGCIPCVFLEIDSAFAEDAQKTSSTETQEQSPTQKWLEFQRSGVAASQHAQPISGQVMDKVHRRYLKSFEHPIPDYYDHAMPVTR